MEKEEIFSHRIMAVEADKRDRILNAAMKEFCNGYAKASTDMIVREAGISKGLLFHYFGTKEKLYEYIVGYACETMLTEFIALINVEQRDLLASVWQMTLLKRDLCYKHPAIFDFLTKAYLSAKNDPSDDHLRQFKAVQEKIVADLYRNFDETLFKEGINPQKAANIIWWTITGYSAREVTADKSSEDYLREYERYLEDIKEYFDIFRQCFYKE